MLKVFEELLLVFVSSVTLFSTSIRHYIHYVTLPVLNSFIHYVLIFNCIDVVLSGVLPVVSRSHHSCVEIPGQVVTFTAVDYDLDLIQVLTTMKQTNIHFHRYYTL